MKPLLQLWKHTFNKLKHFHEKSRQAKRRSSNVCCMRFSNAVICLFFERFLRTLTYTSKLALHNPPMYYGIGTLQLNLTIIRVKVELSLWDTAGQERFHSLGPIYYRDAAAALIVFDITDIDSFERAKAWVKELYQMVQA